MNMVIKKKSLISRGYIWVVNYDGFMKRQIPPLHHDGADGNVPQMIYIRVTMSIKDAVHGQAYPGRS